MQFRPHQKATGSDYACQQRLGSFKLDIRAQAAQSQPQSRHAGVFKFKHASSDWTISDQTFQRRSESIRSHNQAQTEHPSLRLAPSRGASKLRPDRPATTGDRPPKRRQEIPGQMKQSRIRQLQTGFLQTGHPSSAGPDTQGQRGHPNPDRTISD